MRIAWADDADAIAAVQVRAWQVLYADVLPPEALPTDPEPIAAAWRGSLGKPDDARNRVLVALERNRVTGFVLTGPASDPDADPIADGELSEFTLDPDEQRQGPRLPPPAGRRGHARRRPVHPRGHLADRHRRRAARFLTEAGWAPDGAHRELDLDGDGRPRSSRSASTPRSADPSQAQETGVRPRRAAGSARARR